MKVFAHRGASDVYAEHTRAAFAHALAVGADGIETDVQLTADGHLICWHDATLDRTSSGRGLVRDHRLGEMRTLDVHSWKQTSPLLHEYGNADEQLVTLDQLTHMLLGAGRSVELAVEMKIDSPSDGAIEVAVLDWLRRWGWDAMTGTLSPYGQSSDVSVSIMSFSLDALHRVAEVVPSSKLCPLFDADDLQSLGIGTSLWTAPAQLLGPSVGWLIDRPATLDSWTHVGRTVRMWTIETDEQLWTARHLGVQEVTVNDPQWALQRLGAGLEPVFL